MKKYLIISLLSLISILSLHSEVWKKLEINANPINVAVVIVEKGDSAKIADLFDYYGYTLHGTEDGYKVMKDTKGNEIRYSFNVPEAIDQYPKVMVKNKENAVEIDNRLNDLKFKKVGDGYERTINYDKNLITKCFLISGNSLVLQRSKKN